MTVTSFKSSAQTVLLSSNALDKFIKTHKNLSKPSPRLWHDQKNHHHPLPDSPFLEGFHNLTLSNPILRKLESCTDTLRDFNQVHTHLIVSGIFQHPLAASRVVKKLCSSPITFPYAVSPLFDSLQYPDAFICNTIMRGYLNGDDPHGGLHFYYERMLSRGVFPNHYTFPLLVKICSELGSVPGGERAHAQIIKLGVELDLFVRNSLIRMYSVLRNIVAARKLFDASPDSDLVTWNSMIDGYAKNGEVIEARKLFDSMWERDILSWNSMIAGYVAYGDVGAAQELFEIMPCTDLVSWNCMIDGYARIGDVMGARKLFDLMPRRSAVSWNTMLALYVRCRNFVECLRCFDTMVEGGEVMPNEATLVSALTACAHVGRLDKGKRIHSYINDSGIIKPDVLLSTALLTMYAKCGAVDLARVVFDEMTDKNVISWNSMIMGYGMNGHGKEALEMFLEMVTRGIVPNATTFVCVLSACTHAGMVLEGWWYFDQMHRVYNVEPNSEHFGCMVDLLGRAGLLTNFQDLLKQMPVEVGPASWGALLSACRTHSNSTIGELVAKRLIELEPRDIGPYVLLSNIYAAEGNWDAVDSVRMMIHRIGLQKESGFSLVHDGSESYVENDSLHKKSMVYSMLSEMGAQMKLSCRDDHSTKVQN